MYGVVNKCVEDLIVSKYGQEQWDTIKQKAGVAIDIFVSNEAYPDHITYDLVGAATAVLDIPAQMLLIDLGEHWVLKTGAGYYGALLRSGGDTLREFLINLPQFHTRVQLIYPKLQPPTFSCSHIGEMSLQLHYFTHRPGLTDFVVGLIRGLGKLYSTPATAVLLESKAAGADHDIFEISWAIVTA
jgi:hypothetical protein